MERLPQTNPAPAADDGLTADLLALARAVVERLPLADYEADAYLHNYLAPLARKALAWVQGE